MVSDTAVFVTGRQLDWLHYVLASSVDPARCRFVTQQVVQQFHTNRRKKLDLKRRYSRRSVKNK